MNILGVHVIDKRRPTAATGYTRGGYCIRDLGFASASNKITAECISRSRGRPPFIWLVLLHMAADQEKHIEPPYSIPASTPSHPHLHSLISPPSNIYTIPPSPPHRQSLTSFLHCLMESLFPWFHESVCSFASTGLCPSRLLPSPPPPSLDK